MRSVVLYKSEERPAASPLYWEVWEEPSGVVEHWGAVGQEGEVRSFGPSEASFDALVDKARASGYAERSEFHCLIVQVPTAGGWPTNDEIELRWRIESLLDDALGWVGNGHCDGGDAGSGTMNVFCYVVDVEAGARTMIETLREHRLLERLLIAVDDPQTDTMKVLWPEGYQGTFSLI